MHETNITVIEAQHAKFAFKSITTTVLQIVYIRDAVHWLYRGSVYLQNAKRFHVTRECNFIYDRRNKTAFIESFVKRFKISALCSSVKLKVTV